MVNLFEISVNIFEEIIITLFLTLYFGFKYNNGKKYIGFCLVVLVSVVINTIFTLLNVYDGIFGLVYIGIYFIYSAACLKGDIYIKLFVSGFINCVVYFIALLSILMTTILLAVDSGQYFVMGQTRISGVVFSKALLIAVCILLLKFKFNNILKRGNIIILIIIPIITMLSMIGIMQAFLHSNELKYELLLAAVSVMLTNVLTYYVFIKTNNDVERETEIRTLKQKYENDKKYIYDVEKLYSKTCGIRHDIIHHFGVISSLLGDDIGNVREYIQSVTKNQLDVAKSLIRTENEYFDAIANIKLAVCDQLGIKVQIRVMNHSLDRLRSEEIGIIFGNLFDNAIDAAKHTKDKRIELDVQTEGERCSIQMINSIEKSAINNNQSLMTTKEDKEYHGYGIKNIKCIVKKYEGMINFFEENNYFECDILI